MAGYTLMADGVSCEGECFGLMPRCSVYPTGLAAPHFQSWEWPSEILVWQRSPSSQTLLKHSLAVPCQGGGQPGLLLLSSGTAGFFPALLVSLSPQVRAQALCHCWEQEQWAGALCCAGAPSEHSSALPSALFASSSPCLGNLSPGRPPSRGRTCHGVCWASSRCSPAAGALACPVMSSEFQSCSITIPITDILNGPS